MTSKYLIRSIGVLTCMALVATGWDAEAGWRRHHNRKAACCEPVCCEHVCCEPVYQPICCEPVYQPVCCEPVRETVCCETVIVAPVRNYCSSCIVVSENATPNRQVSVTRTESSQQAYVARGTTATTASLQR
jgi:hypothetical protein